MTHADPPAKPVWQVPSPANAVAPPVESTCDPIPRDYRLVGLRRLCDHSRLWMVIHPFANFWRTRKRNPYALLLPFWIGLGIVVAIVIFPWRHDRLYALPFTWLAAVVLFVTGIWIYRRAGSAFSWSQLSGLPEVRGSRAAEPPLAATGIRGHVRHPVYLGHLCQMLAWSLGSGLAVCYGLTALAIATGTVMIVLEERELEQRFGADYRRYRENVPAVFPSRTAYNPNSETPSRKLTAENR